jgi:ATP-binding cassette subfamily F protein uup
MNYLAVENISKSFGDRVLFSDITMYINQGDKVALIAKNGTGKTSLLNIVAGLETPDTGKYWLHPHIRTVFLSQEPALDENFSVFDAVYKSQNPVMQAIAAYEQSLLNHADEDAMQKAISDIDRLDAWNYEARVKQILSVLEVNYLDRKVKSLSGGQRKRVALAKVLIDEPDFLILDEPTNHLDLEMIEWLQDYLSKSKITLLTVTHDRYFLDAVCNHILELEHGTLYKYQGTYTQFLEKKAEREINMAVVLDKTKQLYKKELEWMRRQPQARGTKAKSRIDEFYSIEEKSKQKLGEDLVQLDIQMTRLGSKILELHNVSKAYEGHSLFKNLDYKFAPFDRVGIIGRNGTGKSTLLDIMACITEPDSGKVVHGETLSIGYYNQKGMKIKEDKRAIDVVKDIAEYIPMNGGKKMSAGQLMERFLFDGPKQQTFVSKLSGGEKRRLFLLTLLIKNPNFLILDEPTNDLDIMTLQVLEEFLQHFPGVVVVVSHDRYFMDKIVEHVFVLGETDNVRDFPGNYTDYRMAREHEIQVMKNEASAQKSEQKTEQKSKAVASQDDRKEFKKIEKQIQKLEEDKAKITEHFNNPDLNPDKIMELSKLLQSIQSELEDKEMRWLELSEMM